MKSGKLLPLSVLAKEWGWSVSKLHRLVAARRIPVVRIGPRRDCYFEEEAVERWLATQRVEQRDDSRRVTAPTTHANDDLAAELAEYGVDIRDVTLPH
jgi:hypothetical protein